MSTQKFQHGDLVRVADDLGRSMRHFSGGVDAIVIGSYADQFGGDDRTSYTLNLKGQGETSWYYESQLSLIERDRKDLLSQWEREQSEENEMHADLDWVFSHSDEVLSHPTGASVAALAGCSHDTLWGSHGEGFVYYQNCMAVLSHAESFLKSGDKAGWLQYRVKLSGGSTS